MSNGLHKKEQIQRLYQKFLDNSCTPEEFETLLNLVKNMDDKDERSRLTYEIWKTERARQALQKPFLSKREDKKPHILPPYRKSYLAYKVVVLLLVVITTFLIYLCQLPGWLKGPKVTYLEKMTLPGQKSTILLSDGSRVLLNSGSKLKYPEKFADHNRELTLEGEGFFQVTGNGQKPFIVRSGKLVTTVLGTSFNIKAYPEDPKIEVAVAAGKVEVRSAENDSIQPHLLTPNTIATYNPAVNQIKVDSLDIREFIAWKEGVVKFDGVRFNEVAKTLEKWYGVTVTLENEQIGNCVIFGEFENVSLNSLMQVMQLAIDIEYQFTAEGLIVSGRGCAAKP